MAQASVLLEDGILCFRCTGIFGRPLRMTDTGAQFTCMRCGAVTAKFSCEQIRAKAAAKEENWQTHQMRLRDGFSTFPSILFLLCLYAVGAAVLSLWPSGAPAIVWYAVLYSDAVYTAKSVQHIWGVLTVGQ